MDFGIALGDSTRQYQRSPVYGDIEGGFSLSPFTIAGILGQGRPPLAGTSWTPCWLGVCAAGNRDRYL